MMWRNAVSIVRVGLSENKDCAEGYEAVFGKKKSAPAKKPVAAKSAETVAKKKPAKKKK
jgi:hypothetical protein